MEELMKTLTEKVAPEVARAASDNVRQHIWESAKEACVEEVQEMTPKIERLMDVINSKKVAGRPEGH